ncbi:ribosomal RNA small subunit methyltransferase I [Lampropedia puyangensis]|uniref:Ribosomal RNA small subunit methyltransferase I n=1 Tax=Lampropedia puyangensis TaxID=1330072 RepID=A0A4S8EV78_9BURK|nr:SAM-dependent methyltransferase [Lampropedia puyangensis]THT98777.1 ribosomal RNA small subunit methyltransferase I [Lampropedia puyangensis]
MTTPTPTPRPRGTLYLVPAPLDFGCSEQAPLTDVLPAGTLQQAAQLQHWIVENAKTARAYLKRIDEHVPLAHPLQAMQMVELPREVHKVGDHAGQKTSPAAKGAKNPTPKRTDPPAFDPRSLLRPALDGHDMGLVSEAGMPGVADPGSSIVRAAHQLGLRVVPLTGPISLLLALAASGLNGQSFAFIGYLPQDDSARANALRMYEAHARKTGQAQIAIETPYRNAKLWQACLQHLQADTWLSIHSGISLPTARSQSQSVKSWRKQGEECPMDGKTPAVFIFGC